MRTKDIDAHTETVSRTMNNQHSKTISKGTSKSLVVVGYFSWIGSPTQNTGHRSSCKIQEIISNRVFFWLRRAIACDLIQRHIIKQHRFASSQSLVTGSVDLCFLFNCWRQVKQNFMEGCLSSNVPAPSLH